MTDAAVQFQSPERERLHAALDKSFKDSNDLFLILQEWHMIDQEGRLQIRQHLSALADKLNQLAATVEGINTVTQETNKRGGEAAQRMGAILAQLDAKLDSVLQLAQEKVSIPATVIDRLEALNERLDRIEEQAGITVKKGLIDRVRESAVVLMGGQVGPKKTHANGSVTPIRVD